MVESDWTVRRRKVLFTLCLFLDLTFWWQPEFLSYVYPTVCSSYYNTLLVVLPISLKYHKSVQPVKTPRPCTQVSIEIFRLLVEGELVWKAKQSSRCKINTMSGADDEVVQLTPTGEDTASNPMWNKPTHMLAGSHLNKLIHTRISAVCVHDVQPNAPL